jgi:hypothetical protein
MLPPAKAPLAIVPPGLGPLPIEITPSTPEAMTIEIGEAGSPALPEKFGAVSVLAVGPLEANDRDPSTK